MNNDDPVIATMRGRIKSLKTSLEGVERQVRIKQGELDQFTRMAEKHRLEIAQTYTAISALLTMNDGVDTVSLNVPRQLVTDALDN